MQNPDAFGTWKSTFDAKAASNGSIKLRDCMWDGDDLYWIETRPTEKGRSTLMHWNASDPKTAPREILPAPWNIRSRVHEYGGLAAALGGGIVYFVHYADQQIYRWEIAGGSPTKLTDLADTRFADLALHPGGEFVVCVAETHASQGEPSNTVVLVHTQRGSVSTLLAGADFYSAPRFSPDGKRIAWCEWNHPNMPWDGSRLFVADWEGVDKPAGRLIAGGDSESISEVKWSPNGELVFVSDRSGWWNLYRHSFSEGTLRLTMREADFARPEWSSGQSHYDFLDDGRIFVSFTENGSWKAAFLDGSRLDPLTMPYTEVDWVAAGGGRVAFVGGHGRALPAIVLVGTKGATTAVRSLEIVSLPPQSISVGESMWANVPGGEKVHFFYYPPRNRDYAPKSNRAPLVVICHGGPTAAAATGLNPTIQFWTTRGFGVADVNYSGSTGFGRPYRDRLKGNWGELDPRDCAAAAQLLVDKGLADPQKIAIRGSSAGGLTVLNGLIDFEVFRCGASYYGVADLSALAKKMHKFEARYLDGLVGKWPEDEKTYSARSPINRAQLLAKPVLFLQGLDDTVVPAAQSESMHRLLKERGIQTEYLPFAGEGHGFRQSETLIRCLEAELAFYRSVFRLA